MRTTHNSYNLRQPGLTLVELLVVMAVFGAVITMTYSLVRAFMSRTTTTSEITRLMQNMTFCQQKAIIGQKTVYLEFNLLQRKYRAFTTIAGREAQLDELLEGDENEPGLSDEEERKEKEARELEEAISRSGLDASLIVLSSAKYDEVEEIIEPVEYGESTGIYQILDIFGNSYKELPSYIVAFQPNGFSESLLVQFGTEDNVDRTLYMNRHTGEIKSLAGQVDKVKTTLEEHQIDEEFIDEDDL